MLWMLHRIAVLMVEEKEIPVVVAMTDCEMRSLRSDTVEWSGAAIHIINLDAYSGKISPEEMAKIGIPTGTHYLLLLNKLKNEIN